MTTTLALYSDGVQLTDEKPVEPDRPVELTFSITSITWPVVVNQYGVWNDGIFGLRDVPEIVEYVKPGKYRLNLTPPFV